MVRIPTSHLYQGRSRVKPFLKRSWFAPRNQGLFWELIFSLPLTGNHCKSSSNTKHPEPENLTGWHEAVAGAGGACWADDNPGEWVLHAATRDRQREQW